MVSVLLAYFQASNGNEASWLESYSIFVAVALLTLIQAGCDFGKEYQFLRVFEKTQHTMTRAIRGQYGTLQEIDSTDVVVGDIILLRAGDRVPADCVLVEEQDMFVDEREVLEHNKYCNFVKGTEKQCLSADNSTENPDIVLLKDSLITQGAGRALVLCVGDHTRVQQEHSVGEFNSESDHTPL